MLQSAMAILLVAAQAKTWTSAVEHAVNLNRAAEYRQALAEYSALLCATPVTANAEIHAYALSQMADADAGLANYAESETRAREALAILTNVNGTRTGTFAIAEGVLAEALSAAGKLEEARKTAEHALALGKETFGPSAPRLGILTTTLAQILEESGDLRQAQKLCLQAVDIFEKSGEGSQVELGTAYQNLAVVYLLRGKSRKALAAVDLALGIFERALPPEHPYIRCALRTKLLARY